MKQINSFLLQFLQRHDAKQARRASLTASAILPERHEGQFSRGLIFVVSLGLLLGLLWSSLTPIDEITSGTGRIKTTSEIEVAQHQFGGEVAEVNVRSGDRIEIGDQILAFDTDQLQRELNKLRASRSTLRNEQQLIDYILNGGAPDNLIENSIDPSDEQFLFWAEQTYFAAQLDLVADEESGIRETLQASKLRLKSIKEELFVLEDRRRRYLEIEQSGVLSRNDLESLEREIIQLGRMKIEVESDIAVQKRSLNTSALRKAELIAKRNHEAALRYNELNEQSVSIDQDIAEVVSRIEKSSVRAEVTGTILNLSISNAHQIVAPGEQIAEIVIDGSALRAEIEIPADRIGSIQPGMEARLKVLSYDFTRFGTLIGTVQSISPSSILNSTDQPVFRVQISLPNDGVNVALAGSPLRAGMTVTADIISDRKTVLSYLLKPLRALSDRAFTEA